MSISRWLLRDSLRAWAATLLVPGALVAALLATALGTGFGGLGSLGQLVAGPGAPSPVSAGAPAPAPGHTPRLPAVPIGALGPSGAPGGSSGPSGGSEPLPGARRPHTPHAGAPPRNPASRPPPSAPPTAGGVGRAPEPGQNQTPPPSQPPPGLVNQLGSAAQGVASSVPPPAGPAASDAVGTVVNLVGSAGVQLRSAPPVGP